MKELEEEEMKELEEKGGKKRDESFVARSRGPWEPLFVWSTHQD